MTQAFRSGRVDSVRLRLIPLLPEPGWVTNGRTFHRTRGGHGTLSRPRHPELALCRALIATVRLRTRKTKGAGTRDAGLTMAYKLLDAAEDRWRSVNAPHLVALLRAGATFVHGIKLEREDQRNAA